MTMAHIELFEVKLIDLYSHFQKFYETIGFVESSISNVIGEE
jgi:hypothetical protein